MYKRISTPIPFTTSRRTWLSK